MESGTIDQLESFFKKRPIARGIASSIEDLDNAEKHLGLKFDSDYVQFIITFGGCAVGRREVYGFINSEILDEITIIDLTERYREDGGENMNWLIIGTDYSGNYIGIDESGKLLKYDHDFGELVILAETFEQYLSMACLNHLADPFGNSKGAGVGQDRGDFNNWRTDYWNDRVNKELEKERVKIVLNN